MEHIEAHSHLRKKVNTFFDEDLEPKNWYPPERFKEGQVVRLKNRYGEAYPGSVGVILYYYLVETFGQGVCQVQFYDPFERDGEIYASEQVLIQDLEPCRETPPWVPFDVNEEGCSVARDEGRAQDEESGQVGSPSSGSKPATRLGKIWKSFKDFNVRQRERRQERSKGLKEFFKKLRERANLISRD